MALSRIRDYFQLSVWIDAGLGIDSNRDVHCCFRSFKLLADLGDNPRRARLRPPRTADRQIVLRLCQLRRWSQSRADLKRVAGVYKATPNRTFRPTAAGECWGLGHDNI
jgi:hypothetical protein